MRCRIVRKAGCLSTLPVHTMRVSTPWPSMWAWNSLRRMPDPGSAAGCHLAVVQGEAAPDQVFEEVGPEHFGFRRTDVQADDLAPAIGRNRHGDYRCDRDDAATVAHLQVGGVEPQIPPFALDWPLQEGVDPLVDVLAELGDRALADAAQP